MNSSAVNEDANVLTPAANGTDASRFGFSSDASGIENARALQAAFDAGGTITVSRPGVYPIARTVYVGSNTSVFFGAGVVLKKVDEQGPFTHVILNKGALTRTYDEHIVIDGLHIQVNNVDVRKWEVFGLHGQLAFFYVKDLLINRFRCYDLGKIQYCIHVCTFEDIRVNDVIIHGAKDGVHLGRGKRFVISNGVFKTYDDAVALNAHDYDVGNPELGWIENGIVEKCWDLNAEKTTGFFCRLTAGGWIDWRAGMEVQKSDTVVSAGRMYRVYAEPDGRKYVSQTAPTHDVGTEVLDGIHWVLVQHDVTYTCGVRNVTFRDITLEKPRTGFSFQFDNDRFSRGLYPGAEVPKQQQIVLDNVRVLHDRRQPLMTIGAPTDVVTITNASLKNNPIVFYDCDAVGADLTTTVNLIGCVFNHDREMDVLTNGNSPRRVTFKSTASVVNNTGFAPRIVPGNGHIVVQSDLPIPAES